MTDQSIAMPDPDDNSDNDMSKAMIKLAIIFQQIYEELKKIAKRRAAGQNVIQTTELVQEYYLRLVKQDRQDWDDPVEVLKMASITMQRIVIDATRRSRKSVEFGTADQMADVQTPLLHRKMKQETIDRTVKALDDFQEIDPEAALCFQLNTFCGKSYTKIAEMLGITRHAVRTHVANAKAWIRSEVAVESRKPDQAA